MAEAPFYPNFNIRNLSRENDVIYCVYILYA